MKIGDIIYSTTQAGCLDHYMYESKPLIVTAVEGVRALGDKGPLQDSVIARGTIPNLSPLFLTA